MWYLLKNKKKEEKKDLKIEKEKKREWKRWVDLEIKQNFSWKGLIGKNGGKKKVEEEWI